MTTDPSSDVVERLAYTVANAKLGEGPSVRCEGPTEYEISQARQWVKRVMQAQDATIERLSAERMQLREAAQAAFDLLIESRRGNGKGMTNAEALLRAALSNTAENGRDVLGDDWEDHCGEPGCEMCPRPA